MCRDVGANAPAPLGRRRRTQAPRHRPHSTSGADGRVPSLAGDSGGREGEPLRWGFMGDQLEAIDDKLAAWMTSQPMFFVSTAPLDPQGLVNCSPKGLAGTFAVLGPLQVAYLDLTGSGIETIAHLRENGRMVIMFCAFDGRPRIVRLHGRGSVLLPGEPSFVELAGRFSGHEGVRSIIVLDVARLADSCGYAVPRMTYEADRDVLDLDHRKRGAQGLAEFRAEWNATSLDGLPGLD